MPTSRKAARAMLERAAVYIYSRVEIEEATGIVKRQFDADCSACLVLKKLSQLA